MSGRAQFLEALFGQISGQQVEIRCFPPVAGTDLRPVRRFIPQPDLKAAGWGIGLEGVDPGLDAFVGIATRQDASSGGRDNCGWLAALFIDMDFKYGEEACRARLAEFPVPPSIVVESGAGMHVYWLLKNPLYAPSEATGEHLARLAAAFDGVADAVSSEPARVLRLPDTLNRKYDPPRPVVLTRCDPTRRYALGEILAHCPELAVERRAPEPFTPVAPVGIPVDKTEVKDMAAEFQNRGLYKRYSTKGKHYVVCPWAHEHSSASAESSTAIFEPRAGGRTDLWGFKCQHEHCRKRTIGDVYRIWFGRNLTEAELPHITEDVGPEPAVDPSTWRALFHTHDEFLRAKPLDFVIEEFLQEDGITYLGGLPGHGKTLIMLSLVQALLTGDKLFDHFNVKKRSERVLYLIPESGISAFKQRLELFKLLPFVKEEMLFVRTLSIGEDVKLTDPRMLAAAQGADVFLDTAIRFMEGDENSSSDHREFAQVLFNLQKAGARTIVGAHHSPKSQRPQDQATLENILRGSGDVGAMVSTCWAVQQTDAETNAVTVTNVKAREFLNPPPRPFEITGRPHINETGKFRMSGSPGLFQAKKKPKEMKEESDKVKIARNLKARGFNQTEIAKAIGVDPRTVRQWEKDLKLADVGFDEADETETNE